LTYWRAGRSIGAHRIRGNEANQKLCYGTDMVLSGMIPIKLLKLSLQPIDRINRAICNVMRLELDAAGAGCGWSWMRLELDAAGAG